MQEEKLFASWEPLGFLEHIQVHVVAHVTFGCFLERLVVPGVIPALTQGFVNDPAARLAGADLGIETIKVPARIGPGAKIIQHLLMRRVFGQGSTPPVSSTKSMTGHGQGAAGAMEAIFSLLMLEHDFIAPSINVETLDPDLDPAEIATELKLDAGLDCVMTNSFGFGGTNGSMILSKFHG